MLACVFTLGCKMNEVESESLMQGFSEKGYEVTSELSYADVYVLNTCAVTAEAEKKSRQAVARMRKFNPSAPVLVCGCASHFHPESFAEREGVTVVTGARRKEKLLELLEEKGIYPDVDETVFHEMPTPLRTRTRAFIRIQDGCNRFCSYCIIPYLRGRTRSRSIEKIVAEANLTTAKEIVLTGIDISSYEDGENKLGELLLALKDVSARIRLGSLEESVITEKFLSQMKEAGNVMPHFHLSLQSGSSAVLKKMNRRYTREAYLEKCKLIYRYFPDAAITTDIIVGFPTETEEDFLESVSIVEEAGFAEVHCFPFSPREGTVAAKWKGLSSEVKHERNLRLISVAEKAKEKYLDKFKDRELVALFESDGGYTENYVRVYSDEAKEGELWKVLPEKREKDGFAVRLIEKL